MTVRGFRVFDNHLHVHPVEMASPGIHAFLDPEGTTDAFFHELTDDAAHLLAHMDEEGIEHAGLVTYVEPERFGYPPELNDWVAGYVDGHRDRLTPIGSVHPDHVPDVQDELARLVDELGIRAFKLHPPHQRIDPLEVHDDTERGRGLRAWFAFLEERGLPLVVHTGTSVFPPAVSRLGEPMRLDDVAVEFPDLPLVLAHSGRPLWCDQAFFLARRHPNAHLDLSGIPPHRLPDYLPRLPEVAHKTVWGTDWPGPGVTSMRANVEAFLDADTGLTEDQEEAILWGNNLQLFGDD